MNISYDQYQMAYGHLPHVGPPPAGWTAQGFGWQLEPQAWAHDVSDSHDAVEEPPVTVQKTHKQENLFGIFGDPLKHLTDVLDDKFGEKGSGFRVRGEVQDFYRIREQCLEQGILWEDPQFPANDKSLFYSKSPNRNIRWMRPMEFADNPQFFVEGYSRFDVQQGELGDCWLLAAVANITLFRKLFFQVVPDDQGFSDNYAGVFHFRFWQYGRWIDVVVDDRLPTYNGRLIYMHSSEENEFWSALLEKAYAKLHGSYEALRGGSTCEAMEDFTGGVTELYELESAPPNLFKILLKAYERSSLMGCSIPPDPNVLEAETPEGLIQGHAYSITCVKYVDIETPNTSGKIPLLRLRNPWGNEAEWRGPWSDSSPEWRFIPEHVKQDIGLTFDDDGEFWMSYRDFLKYFSMLEICNLDPDSLGDEEVETSGKKRWETSVFEGEWVRGVTAGGCRNHLDTFWHNPQYRITLTDPDDEDEDDKCTVIIALMQKNRRHQKNIGLDLLSIGFVLYHLPDPDDTPKPLDKNFFKYNAIIARSLFADIREISCRFKLPQGTYCIIPSTFDPNEEGEFLLRVFSEHKNNMEENDEQVGITEIDARVKDHEVPVEEEKELDKTKEFFLKLAGDDMEVDWKELKEILDYAMKSELPAKATETSGGDDGSFLNNLLSLICGAACKDSPLADAFYGSNVTSTELRNTGFSKDICRSMVAMMDTDYSGKLGYEEFKLLWTDIRNWKTVFKMYSQGTNQLSAFELREALNSAGYKLNNHILNVIGHRYAAKDGCITFDDFILCAVRLKTMLDLFKAKDTTGSDKATFSLEEWLQKTVYS